jgi:hypothetical protein
MPMAIAQRTGFETARSEVKSYDMSIVLGYAAFAVVLLIAIYLGAISGGMPGDFAAMTVYP